MLNQRWISAYCLSRQGVFWFFFFFSILIFNLKNIFRWVKRELALKNWFQVHTEEKFDVTFWRFVEPAKQKTRLTRGVMWVISCVVTSFSCGKLNVLNLGGTEENLAKPAVRDDTQSLPCAKLSVQCFVPYFSLFFYHRKALFCLFSKVEIESPRE